MIKAPTVEPLLRFYFGRDWLRGSGYMAWLQFIPRTDLMRYNEEGQVRLAALHVEVKFRPLWNGRTERWQLPFIVWWKSDAHEITRRIAEAHVYTAADIASADEYAASLVIVGR